MYFAILLAGLLTMALCVCLLNQEVELCPHTYKHNLPLFLECLLAYTCKCCVCASVRVCVLQGHHNCKCKSCMTITVTN